MVELAWRPRHFNSNLSCDWNRPRTSSAARITFLSSGFRSLLLSFSWFEISNATATSAFERHCWNHSFRSCDCCWCSGQSLISQLCSLRSHFSGCQTCSIRLLLHSWWQSLAVCFTMRGLFGTMLRSAVSLRSGACETAFWYALHWLVYAVELCMKWMCSGCNLSWH